MLRTADGIKCVVEYRMRSCQLPVDSDNRDNKHTQLLWVRT